MKKIFSRKQLYILSTIVTLGLLSGCATANKAGKRITVSLENDVVTQDSTCNFCMDLIFNIPDNYFNRRSRLVITPQLMVGDSVLDKYIPIVLDAPIYSKKKHRLEVLENHTDPYAGEAVAVDNVSYSFKIPYSQVITLPDTVGNARLRGVVTTDGCGKCKGMDTVDIAGIANPVNLIDVRKSLKLSWIEPEFVIRPKEMEGRGVANLQFAINKSDINLSLGNNRSELEDMLNTLSPILEDSLATLTSLDICGMASADGSLAHNTVLARNRAESAKKWLIDTLGKDVDIQSIITFGSRPEGWQPVLDAMIADGNPDSVKVMEILRQYEGYNDDVQERHIRSLSCWKQIREKYLQNDRKVEYVFTYTIRSFTTDEELLDMYEKRPDAFNEDELLRVAALAATPEEKKAVYSTILKYFPQSQVAANNLAVLYLSEGDNDSAYEVLMSLDEYSEETLNTLAAGYVYSNDYERAIELLQGVDLPAASYNLGLLMARQRKFTQAYEHLYPFADVNSAICALSLNKNIVAKSIMDGCDDVRPVAEYVRAMICARLEEDDKYIVYLENACEDDILRVRAKTEPDFFKYSSDKAFINAVNR